MDWQVAYLRAVGAPLTAANVRFLNTWQRFEGGHTNNNAKFNYLNTTWGKQYPTINGVRVRSYPNLDVGAQAFASTLEANRNYQGILQGLRVGDPYKLGGRVAAGLSTWVSGSPTGNPGYADRILGSHATPQPPAGGSADTSPPSAPNLAAGPDLSGAVLANLATPHIRPTEQLSNLVAAVAAGAAPSPGPLPTPQASPASHPQGFKVGDPIPAAYQTSVGGEHPTAGLAGFPARDYFAKAGSPVVAPVAGKIVRFSGHDPKRGAVEGAGGPLGWSIYIRGADGRTYYLTHLGSRTVHVGQTVEAGTPIGTVANYDKYGRASHVHMGVSG